MLQQLNGFKTFWGALLFSAGYFAQRVATATPETYPAIAMEAVGAGVALWGLWHKGVKERDGQFR